MNDDRFDVYVRSGAARVTLLQGADLKTATERARHVAKTERRSAFVINKMIHAEQEFKPPFGENYRRALEAHGRGQLTAVHNRVSGGAEYAASVNETDGTGVVLSRDLEVSRDEAIELLELDGGAWTGTEVADPRRLCAAPAFYKVRGPAGEDDEERACANCGRSEAEHQPRDAGAPKAG